MSCQSRLTPSLSQSSSTNVFKVTIATQLGIFRPPEWYGKIRHIIEQGFQPVFNHVVEFLTFFNLVDFRSEQCRHFVDAIVKSLSPVFLIGFQELIIQEKL